MIATLPGPNGTRLTLFNAQFNMRHTSGKVERRLLESHDDYRTVLRERFGMALSNQDLETALANVERRGTRGPTHPFIA